MDSTQIQQMYDNGQHLYFIKGGRYVKVGVAKHPLGRLNDMQTGNPYKLRLLLVVPYGGFMMESLVHESLKRQGAHYRGEWYLNGAPMQKEIKRLKHICKDAKFTYSIEHNTPIYL